jgi:hypothetical protein
MSGYLDRRDPDVPPMTRDRWIAVAVAFLGGALTMFIALYADKGATGPIGRISPAAPLWITAGLVLLLQREPDPDEVQPLVKPWRDRRLMAAFLFIVGVALLALPFVTKF